MAKGTITLSGSTVGTKMESLEVEQGATGGVAGLFKVDNNDTDKVAMSIEAANIDADVMDISMDAVTTAKGIDITADGLTTGNALYIDDNSVQYVKNQREFNEWPGKRAVKDKLVRILFRNLK